MQETGLVHRLEAVALDTRSRLRDRPCHPPTGELPFSHPARNLFLARMSIEHPQSLRYTCSRDPASTDCLSRCLSVPGSTHTNSTAWECIPTTTSLHRPTLDPTLDQPVSMSTTVRCSSSDTPLGGGLLPITSRADPEDRQQNGKSGKYMSYRV
jgi:hypothetical protein